MILLRWLESWGELGGCWVKMGCASMGTPREVMEGTPFPQEQQYITAQPHKFHINKYIHTHTCIYIYKYIYVCLQRCVCARAHWKSPLSLAEHRAGSTSHLLLLCQAAGSGSNSWEKKGGKKQFESDKTRSFSMEMLQMSKNQTQP